ncbi:MAG TPA: FtsX-like permease family protein [Polyangiaceae bacterium]|nr:FtsX-like permease family protein [Polyangiaceae bacterium]
MSWPWWIAPLERKLFRELLQLKGQILTIALVVGSGITSFAALRGTYESLEASRSRYYDDRRFAHVFANAKRAPTDVARQVEALPGVAVVETRTTGEITLPVESLRRPAYGRLLSIPSGHEPATNAPHLRRGRWPERGAPDEVAVLESFAEAHGLAPGDRLDAVIEGRLRTLRITGVALSPEFVFAIRPGALAHDPKRYAVLWMERGAAASALGLEGAFNELSVRLEPGASEDEVKAGIDRLLAAHGGFGAFGRKDQISHRILSQELSQLHTLATMVPLIFLAVTVFLVNLVLGRLVHLQRTEIATLKAIGYSNRTLFAHYCSLVAAVVLPGGALGIIGGHALGSRVLALYERAFRFPTLEFRLSAAVVLIGLFASAGAALVGALGAVWSAAQLPPAVAMRPPAPAAYRQSRLDRWRMSALLSQSGRMVLREIQRRPLRSLLSALGMAGAAALLILGRFAWDSLLHYFDDTFLREQRQDLQVVFTKPLPPRAVGELGAWRGVRRAEGVRSVAVRARHEQRWRETVMIAIAPDATLRRLVSKAGAIAAAPRDGVVVSEALAQVLGFDIGDSLELLLREGERRTVSVPVVGTLDDAVGLGVYAPTELIASLERDAGAVSSVLLDVEPDAIASIEARLRQSPAVLDVSDVRDDMNRLLDMNAQVMDVWTAVSVLLAASVVFGVVYNNARITAAARSRELASLRVLGFTRREVSAILLYSLVIEVAVAIPVGLWLGGVWARWFMRSIDRESFRWQVVIAPETYLMVVVVVLTAAAASALWVRRSIDRLDLIGVLKSRE